VIPSISLPRPPALRSPRTQPGRTGARVGAPSPARLLTRAGSGLWLSLRSRSPRGRVSIAPLPPLQKNFIGVCAANRFKKITSSGSLTELGV